MATKIKSGVIGTLDSNLVFADNSKAVFGAGSDLQIYHDGSNSIISEEGTGGIKILTAGVSTSGFYKIGGEELATFEPDGPVTLYHNDVAKLATTSTGINVTGTATATNMQVSNGGKYIFGGENTRITGEIDGNGKIRMFTGGTEKVILDGSKVGIGTNSPSSYHSLANNLVIASAADTGMTIASGTSSDGRIFFADGTSGSAESQGQIRYDHNGNYMAIHTADSERMRIDSSGNLIVGKTSTAFGTDGAVLYASGYNDFVNTNAVCQSLNRLSSDGAIADYYKDSTKVGSIGASVGDLTIYGTAAGHSGFRFTSGGIAPVNNTGSLSADSVDIGQSSWKFRDIYLSNTIGNGAGEEITFNNAQDYLRFDTTGSERMRIDSSGKVAIGSTTGTSGYSASHLLTLQRINDDPIQIRAGTTSQGQPSEGTGISWTWDDASTNADTWASIRAIFPGNSDTHLTFSTKPTGSGGSNTERMRLTNEGTLSINSTTDSFSGMATGRGHIFRPNGESFHSTNDAGSQNTLHVYDYADSTYRFYVRASGSSAGNIYATNTSITGLSDKRLKENIVDLETGLTEVMSLQPRRFDWKNGDAQNVAGFIAQEVESVLPELVGDYKHEELEDCKSLKMGDMIPTLVKAIQEQQTLIESLTARITELEG